MEIDKTLDPYNQDKASKAILINSWSGKITQGGLICLRDRLDTVDDSKLIYLGSLRLKSPVVGLLFGIFVGGFGADRFYKGDVSLGIAKLVASLVIIALMSVNFAESEELGEAINYFINELLIGNLCSIWAFIDLFVVWKGIRKTILGK